MRGPSRSSAPSALTDKVKTINHQGKGKAIPASTISLNDNGSLSDDDEMRGDEREAAITSPPKGKEQVTSEVCKRFYLIQWSNCHN